MATIKARIVTYDNIDGQKFLGNFALPAVPSVGNELRSENFRYLVDDVIFDLDTKPFSIEVVVTVISR